MSKNKDYDWNAAYIGGEDWKAAMDSEIFRNFVAIELRKEAMEESNKEHKTETLDDVFEIIRKSAEPTLNQMPNPIMSNFSYESEDEEFVDELDDEFVDDEGVTPNEGTQLEMEASLKEFERMIKEANLKEAEKELGLDNNYYFKITRGKDV